MSTDKHLMSLLQTLRRRLEAVRQDEIHDTYVRERMFLAVERGFIEPEPDYNVPRTFGMFSNEADDLIHEAISDFVYFANQRADEIGLTDPRDRLAAFEDDGICEGFFGASPIE